MATTPWMSLSLPTVSTTAGPAWASMVNAALTTLDGHNHAPGFGPQVPSAGLNINADVAWNGYNLTIVRTLRLQNLGSPPALGTDVACLAASGGNLYWINASGQAVQVTAGASLNGASLGAIGGDYSGSGASEVYVAASQTFQFFQAANKYANLDAGNVILREPGATSPQGITLKSPAALAASYALTLPATLPASTQPLSVSAAGVVSAAQITAAQVANGTLTNAQQNFGTPSVATDVATKGYADGLPGRALVAALILTSGPNACTVSAQTGSITLSATMTSSIYTITIPGLTTGGIWVATPAAASDGYTVAGYVSGPNTLLVWCNASFPALFSSASNRNICIAVYKL